MKPSIILDKIGFFCKYYFLYVLFPVGLLLLCFSSYYYVTEPSLFYYQKVDCKGSFDCEPATGEGIHVFGVKVSKEFFIPVLDDGEFKEREKFTKNITNKIALAFLVLSGYVVYFAYKKLNRGVSS